MTGRARPPLTSGQQAFLLTLFLVAVGLWVAAGELVPGNSRLYDAIDEGDSAAVAALLADGADPNSRSRGLAGGRTERYLFPPLIFALRRNQPAIALQLIEAGADPGARDPRGGDALSLARDGGMSEVEAALARRLQRR
ncbi:MAG: ankyrin repeat domain-containing protein [Vicinamibacterales bacterium]